MTHSPSPPTSDVIALADRLGVRLTADPDLVLEGDPEYQAFQRALAAVDAPEDLRAFVEQPDRFEPQYVRFPGLRRLADLVEPDAYLAHIIHGLASWIGTATVDEKYEWAERAAELAPTDRRILWHLLFARADAGEAAQLEVVDRLAALGDPEAPAARTYVTAVGQEGWDQVAQRLAGLAHALPGPTPSEVFARLRRRRA
jgi:hypothetical protein